MSIMEFHEREREDRGPLIDLPMSAWRLSISIALGPYVSDHHKTAIGVQFLEI